MVGTKLGTVADARPFAETPIRGGRPFVPTHPRIVKHPLRQGGYAEIVAACSRKISGWGKVIIN